MVAKGKEVEDYLHSELGMDIDAAIAVAYVISRDKGVLNDLTQDNLEMVMTSLVELNQSMASAISEVNKLLK